MSYHRELGQTGIEHDPKEFEASLARAEKGRSKKKKGFWDFFEEALTPKTPSAPAAPTAPDAPPPRAGMPGWVVPAAIGGGALVLFLVLKR